MTKTFLLYLYMLFTLSMDLRKNNLTRLLNQMLLEATTVGAICTWAA